STWITAETLFTALLVLSIVMLIRSLSQQGGVRLSFVAGLALGITTLVRGTTQFLPVFFFVISGFQGIPKRLVKCTLFLLGMCLLVLPWTWRNLYTLGEPIIVQTGFGAVFLQGSRSEYLTIPGRQALVEKLVQSTDREGISDKKATSEDRRLFNLGVHEYRMRLEQEPWSFFPFIIHKFARLWYGLDTGIFYQQFFLGLCSLVIMPIAIYQIWLWRIDHLYLSLIIGLLFLYLTI